MMTVESVEIERSKTEISVSSALELPVLVRYGTRFKARKQVMIATMKKTAMLYGVRSDFLLYPPPRGDVVVSVFHYYI